MEPIIENLRFIPEPKLLFGHGQLLEDPRDGLTLFGPLEQGRPEGIRMGVIGTKDGIKRFKSWVNKIHSPISIEKYSIARPMFPGFEAVFQTKWNSEPTIEIEIPSDEIDKAIHIDDSHQRVFKAVSVYSDKIIDSLQKEESVADIWFVIVPDEVHRLCRPRSVVDAGLKIKGDVSISFKEAKRLIKQPSLFSHINDSTIPYRYDVDFRNQLKARLLKYKVSTQIIRESTVAYEDFLNSAGKPKRDLAQLRSAIAWFLSTAAFYKVGGRPWKLGCIREGVCYLGLVFKKDDKNTDPKTACCAAQMFLDSGDGVVFRGAVGPWYTPGSGDFHLSKGAAKELITLALEAYKKSTNKYPGELFIHGQVRFNDEEWVGFKECVPSSTNLVGVRIRPNDNEIKLFRKGDLPILRGMAYARSETSAYLWTKGYVPRLCTYPGREVPKPLMIDVCRGESPLEVVLRDILALTKLNYNACLFADGTPVTLKFADAVGEILTAGPLEDMPPLPFRYYI